MTETGGLIEIYVRPCAECGRQAVTSSLCLRPDLCPACFGASLIAAGWTSTPVPILDPEADRMAADRRSER